MVCPRCGLRHRTRADGRCPRCGAARETAGVAPPAAAPPQAPPARSRLPVRRLALALPVLCLIAGAAAWGLVRRVGPGAQAVATFPRGHVTVSELETELGALPQDLRRARPALLGELASALAYRRALAEEARAAGLTTGARGALGERDLVRALLRKEGLAAPASRADAVTHWRAFWKLVERAVRGKVHVEVERLARVRAGAERPVPAPPAGAGAGGPEPWFLADPSVPGASCRGELHGTRGFYTAACEGARDAFEPLTPYHVLYLESTYGPVEGFLHVYPDDAWREEILVARANALDTSLRPASAPAEFLSHYRASLAEVSTSGAVDPEAARRHFERAAGAVEHCLGELHWNIGYPEHEGTIVLELELAPGSWPRGTVRKVGLTAPVDERLRVTARQGPAARLDQVFSEAACLHPLRVFELAGSGNATFTVRVSAP